MIPWIERVESPRNCDHVGEEGLDVDEGCEPVGLMEGSGGGLITELAKRASG